MLEFATFAELFNYPDRSGAASAHGEYIDRIGTLDVPYLGAQVNARVSAANGVTGAARRKAWSDLDVDLMRNDPPWAPFLHLTMPNFVSRSFVCFLYQPVYGMGLAAACKRWR